jgi:hypothetical protein
VFVTDENGVDERFGDAEKTAATVSARLHQTSNWHYRTNHHHLRAYAATPTDTALFSIEAIWSFPALLHECSLFTPATAHD